ncbi:hypothetical protein FOL47_010936 [Perkinsus chesapeaki]|uniref:Uncharacterized protein n=1 Tax=Perkinsus chesapeaki TaxID=330153 RepID=A0A7J6N1I7_PERCH|nr:hypothetical protein FOL47_010936 [Perkinsus chesapeaki]
MPTIAPDRAVTSAGSFARGDTAVSDETRDELAQENPRWSMLDAVHHLIGVKSSYHSRALMVLRYSGLEEDSLKDHMKRIRDAFLQWQDSRAQRKAERLDRGEEPEALSHLDEFAALSGLVLPCMHRAAPDRTSYWVLMLLEGPNPALAQAVTWARDSSPSESSSRPAVHVLMFSEMRTTQLLSGVHFCCCMDLHEGRPIKGADRSSLVEDEGVADQDKVSSAVWMAYRDLVTLAYEASEALSQTPSPGDLEAYIRKNTDLLPSTQAMATIETLAEEYILSADDFLHLLIGKDGPSIGVLESDLVWPMPPPLSY